MYGRPGSYEYETVTDTDLTPTYDYTAPLWGSTDVVTLAATRQTRTAGVTPAIGVQRTEETRYLVPWDNTTPTFTYYGYVGWLGICEGHAPATEVELWARWETHGAAGGGGWITETVATVHGYDGLGRPVTLLDITGLEDAYRRAGSWLVAWTELGALGGGPDGVERGALGAVTAAILRRSALPVDWSGVLGVTGRLDRYTIGGYVDDDVDPVAWCRDRLAPYGARVRWQRGGVGLALAWEPQPIAIASIDLDAEGQLAGPVRYTAATADVVIVTWARADTAAGQIARSRLEALDRAADGAVTEITLPECWESTTALGAGQVELDRVGPQVECAIAIDAETWWWLRCGDVVDLSLDSLGWEAGARSRWRIVSCEHATDRRRTLTLRRIERRRHRAYATVSSAAATP